MGHVRVEHRATYYEILVAEHESLVSELSLHAVDSDCDHVSGLIGDITEEQFQ